MIVAGDVRGHVMVWRTGPRDDSELYKKEPYVIGQMSDAVRGVHIDNYSLKTISFDASSLIWDFW